MSQEHPQNQPPEESSGKKDHLPSSKKEDTEELFDIFSKGSSRELTMMLQRIGPISNPFVEKLAEKVTDKHIDKLLDLAIKDEDYSYKDARQSRWFHLIYFLIFAALFIFITIFLVNTDRDLYLEVLKYLVTFIGGFGGGFGLKTYMDKSH